MKKQCALIVGANRGIGLACTRYLLHHHPKLHVFATHRVSISHELEKLKHEYKNSLRVLCMPSVTEPDVQSLSHRIMNDFQVKRLRTILNCVGWLSDEEFKPERSITHFNQEYARKQFQVNALLSPLLVKHMLPLLCHKDTFSVFATLSARVGSISDNKLGGWHSYRASKASLNMFMKTVSLEFEQRRFNAAAIVIHPGTTITDLSKPFITRTKYQLHSSEETAQNIMSNILDQATVADNGKFFAYDGTVIPW